jgi:dTDP-4-amino-4,6-dideoxygalactose transaminase
MLERLPAIAARRRRVADIYREVLTDEDDVTLAPIPPEAEPVYTHFPLLLPPGKREAVVSGLWSAGIDPGFNFSYICGGAAAAAIAPVASCYMGRVLTLPVSSRIDDRLARHIAETLRSVVCKV